ncbi:AAA-associated domain-containing protein [Haloarcula amylovorans]|uniref:AAA-associated domain-containing protein n=1 Tax=Haloarcula amylovorans TaxID=2562280 RepID=UPI001076A80C
MCRGSVRVRPRRIHRVVSEGRLLCIIAEGYDFSENHVNKLLSTLYSLNLAYRNSTVKLTDLGERVKDAPEEERKKLIRDSLLDLTLVKKYCELAPEGPFKNQELMGQVGRSLDRDWSETTRSTNAKRIYQWLLYSELFREVKRGTLAPTATANRKGVASLEDYE